MAIETTIPAGAGGAARRLEALEAQLARSVRAARTRNMLTLVLAVVSLALIAFYLSRASRTFTSVLEPETLSRAGSARLIEAMPAAAADMKKSLRANAPSVIATGEQRLRELPDRFATVLQKQVEQQVEARRPEAEEKLYQTLKASLDEADRRVAEVAGQTQNDEERFKVLLDTLVMAYGTQTDKLLTDLHARYTTGATDIIGHLDRLAEGKLLTPQEEAQRTMIHNFLVLAREHHGNSTTAASGGGSSTAAVVPVEAQPASAAVPPTTPETPAAQPAAPAADPGGTGAAPKEPAPADQPAPAAK